MDPNRISYLFQQYENDSITIDEREELYSLLRSFENNDEILAWLENSYQNTIPQPINTERWKPILDYILQQEQTKVIPLRTSKRTGIRWLVAASVILLLGIATYTVISKRSEKSPDVVTIAKDIPAPKETRAVITLANGQKLYLDSAGNGVLAQESNVNVVKNKKGEISYNTVNASTPLSMTYNTLYNPRGSKAISLTLSDGTKVWLNSESSLRYPASFASSGVREVEITGEAYFEVAHNASKPFHVKKDGTDITVLGTHFNVNAYDDIKVTLLEGSVRVKSEIGSQKSEKTIRPGEQAIVNQVNPSISRIEVQTNVDTDEVMSWKNGRFQFSDASIETILKEISRYYDAEIIYNDKIPGHFVADISRDVPVSKLLQILELTNRVHFKIEGKKIIVSK